MPSIPQTQLLEDAIAVTPISSHTYAAHLSKAWAIGAVPHGGYTTAILYRLARVHFQNAHPKLHHGNPRPIAFQLSFLRKTGTGPAVLTVQDIKLGQRISTIHVTLSQPNAKNGKSEDKIAGYLTISDDPSETGIDVKSSWQLYPTPPAWSAPHGITRWERVALSNPASPAVSHVEIYCPVPQQEESTAGVVDQWARLRPGGHAGRWTGEALAYLTDIFPLALYRLQDVANAELRKAEKLEEEGAWKPVPFWFPTVTLNIDFKKTLPPEGVEWLYSRITMKAVKNGRTDIDVVILDEQGEIVALATHVGLVVNMSRNESKVPNTKL